MEVVIVGLAALLTSVLSAVAGLGGGVVLLAVIAQFHAPVVAIPIQGGIQLVSNSSRAAMLRRHINWDAVGRSAVLVLPASLLGVLLATSVPEDGTRLVLGVFVLVVAWRPGLLRWRGRDDLPPNALVGVGAVSGLLNTTVGASGPMTSPFFRAVTATHVAFVATAGTAQVIAHLSKLLAFGLDGFSFADHLDLMVVGACGVVVGSALGTRLVHGIDESRLAMLFKVVLTALGLRLVLRAVL